MKKMILALLLLPSWAGAGFDTKWVETEVVLDRDGKGQVAYAVRWSAHGRDLHGFYFEGAAETPVFDHKGAYAVDDRGGRYGLEIKHVSGNKYDIILADGQGFQGGDITYFFRYAADFQAAGTLTQTMAGDKRLAVFNWSPVQWDEPLEHMTVKVIYPFPIAGGQVGEPELKGVNFMTEKFVNKEYLIDYPATDNGKGETLFTVRYHRSAPGTKYHFRIQSYVDAALFDLKTMASTGVLAGKPAGPWKAAPEKYYLGRYFPGGLLGTLPVTRGETFMLMLVFGAVFFAVPFVIMTRKHNSMLEAQAGISNINWDGAEWTPPKAQVSTFRKPGKVAKDLSPIEAGVLLGLPLAELGALMLGNMERKGLLKIISPDPLRVERAQGAFTSNDPYEQLLLGAVRPDGTVEEASLTSMVKSITAGMEQKIWDADLEATKAYYAARAETEKGEAPNNDSGWYWGAYRRRRGLYAHNRYDRTEAVGKGLSVPLGQAGGLNFDTFRTSASCYEGAFGRDACHDACHSACHSACHNACHSACHSACHGACHSACVSGGGH